MVSSPAKPRRSQEERSAATRARLLDATVECLTRYGYAGTTTPRIAAAAGLTRGAQIHHFGSKHELLVAAVHHMTANMVGTVVAEFQHGFTTASDPLGVLFGLLWETHSGPGFIALAELWIAGRTDPALAREVAKFELIAGSAVDTALLGAVPSNLHEAMVKFTFAAMDTLRGILIPCFVDGDTSRARGRWESATEGLRRATDPALAEWLATSANLTSR